MNDNQKKYILIITALAALMAATRMHHFGSALHLPDASLAVFMLAGILVASPLFFAALLVEAALLDYVAIAHLSVNDYCVTPAYWFLLPTCAIMWYAGRYYRSRHSQSWRGLSLFAATASLAACAAFVVSSGSFYLFSGRFAEMNLLQYADSVSGYFIQYLGGVFFYLSIAVGVQIAVLSRRSGLT